VGFRLTGPLTRARRTRADDRERHEVLRTSLVDEDGEPVALVVPDARPRVELTD